MNVLIIEDEQPAADRLIRILESIDSKISVIGVLQSVREAKDWFREVEHKTDLIFMDIRLRDGLSFEIFEEVEIKVPVIFVTAFDQYALEAFKVNGIDYLLKPISHKAVEISLDKIKKLKNNLDQLYPATEYQQLQDIISNISSRKYKSRFIVKVGEHIRSVPVERIHLFYAEGRDVYLMDKEMNKYIIDYNLEDLENSLDPVYFQRVNRSYILNIDAIRDVIKYSNSRLRIIPKSDLKEEIIVSRDRVTQFKSWFDGL